MGCLYETLRKNFDVKEALLFVGGAITSPILIPNLVFAASGGRMKISLKNGSFFKTEVLWLSPHGVEFTLQTAQNFLKRKKGMVIII